MDKAIVRPALPEDWPAIQACHNEIEILLGMKLDLPKFDDKTMASWWVAERDGVVTNFCYQEITIEHVHGGLDPRGTAALIAAKEKIYAPIKAAGTRFAHCMVPKEVDDQVGKHCQGAGFEPTGFVHYRMDL